MDRLEYTEVPDEVLRQLLDDLGMGDHWANNSDTTRLLVAFDPETGEGCLVTKQSCPIADTTLEVYDLRAPAASRGGGTGESQGSQDPGGDTSSPSAEGMAKSNASKGRNAKPKSKSKSQPEGVKLKDF